MTTRALWLTSFLVMLVTPLFLGIRLPGAETEVRSHPPLRPLPEPTHRPMSDGPAFFVDSEKGRDENMGTKEPPLEHGGGSSSTTRHTLCAWPGPPRGACRSHEFSGRDLMINETAPLSPTRPFHVLYEKQLNAGDIPMWNPTKF